MEGEQEAIAEVEAETPIEPEMEADEPQDLNAMGETPDVEETEPEPDPDEEEFDWNGRKVKGPKGLKDGVLMHGDYTRKTQELSATRKELDERRQRIEQQAKASEEEIAHRATLHHIDSELKRFEQFDWAQYQQLRQTDPLGADEAWNYVQHLRGQRQEVTGKISEAANARTLEAQHDVAKRLEETVKFARENIQGWTPETDKQVLDFALSKGATIEDLRGIMSPLTYQMLYLARIGEQSLTKATTAKPAQPKPQPLTTVASKGNPSARKSLADMDMDEYAAFRKKQDAASGGR